MKTIILDLCGGTGSWSKPYREAGFEVHVITLPDYDIRKAFVTNGYLNIPKLTGADGERHSLRIDISKIYGIFAAPPCTHFSFARTTAKTPRDFDGAMEIVEKCLKIIWSIRRQEKIKFWALENPHGFLDQFLGKPVFKFQPYDFGDNYSKETHIWGYFNFPKKKPVKLTAIQLRQSKINTRPLPKLPEGYVPAVESQLQARRAMTSPKFAEAFFKANHA